MILGVEGMKREKENVKMVYPSGEASGKGCICILLELGEVGTTKGKIPVIVKIWEGISNFRHEK